jgi:hypothetical protein
VHVYEGRMLGNWGRMLGNWRRAAARRVDAMPMQSSSTPPRR